MLFTAMLRENGAKVTMAFAIRPTLLELPPMERIESLDLGFAEGHTQPAGASAGYAPCVHFGHTPSSLMSPYRLALCLLTLGWSERELARRTGEHRNTVRRWLASESAVDPDVAAWLEILMAVHLANPGPRRKPLAIYRITEGDGPDAVADAHR
jgi:Helix-turn-helix